MSKTVYKKKFGAVVILDALGASEFSDSQIKAFLASRSELNKGVREMATGIAEYIGELGGTSPEDPAIFTFGDTLVLTFPLTNKKGRINVLHILIILRSYLFNSLLRSIMFRGAFSIGNYFEDDRTNTVMGEAVSDAARWYGRAEWLGVISTPKTSNLLEQIILQERQHGLASIDDNVYLTKFPVPLKENQVLPLYTICWPSKFFEESSLEQSKKSDARLWFFEAISKFDIPLGTENKYENTKNYFSYIEGKLLEKTPPP